MARSIAGHAAGTGAPVVGAHDRFAGQAQNHPGTGNRLGKMATRLVGAVFLDWVFRGFYGFIALIHFHFL